MRIEAFEMLLRREIIDLNSLIDSIRLIKALFLGTVNNAMNTLDIVRIVYRLSLQ